MSQLPAKDPSQQKQQRTLSQLYPLLGKQVKSYHKQRQMGENSSVPVELAQELMASVEFTLDQAGGIFSRELIEETLQIGQHILEEKTARAKSLLSLVSATAPQWQTECRWDALRCIQQYLFRYDHLHLAHKTPDSLFYPMILSVPDNLEGIDVCLFYLNMLWLENQIMASVEESVLEQLWDRLPLDMPNQCEQLLINGIGKALLSPYFTGLVFQPHERDALYSRLAGKSPEELHTLLCRAANQLCAWLELSDEHALSYVKAVVPMLQAFLVKAISSRSLDAIFL